MPRSHGTLKAGREAGGLRSLRRLALLVIASTSEIVQARIGRGEFPLDFI